MRYRSTNKTARPIAAKPCVPPFLNRLQRKEVIKLMRFSKAVVKCRVPILIVTLLLMIPAALGMAGTRSL